MNSISGQKNLGFGVSPEYLNGFLNSKTAKKAGYNIVRSEVPGGLLKFGTDTAELPDMVELSIVNGEGKQMANLDIVGAGEKQTSRLHGYVVPLSAIELTPQEAFKSLAEMFTPTGIRMTLEKASKICPCPDRRELEILEEEAKLVDQAIIQKKLDKTF